MNYTIDIVAQRTGLTKNVIRAWELRYKALSPMRTESNRRLYSDEDIFKLSLLYELTNNGFRIGNIVSLSVDELLNLKSENKNYTINKHSEKNTFKDEIASFIRFIQEFDEKNIKQNLNYLTVRLPKKTIITEIILPLFHSIGNMWREGTLRISHEHFATAIFKNYLFSLKESEEISEFAPNIVVCSPTGQHHELAAVSISVLAATIGLNAIYLGSNVPSEEIASASIRSNSRYVIISIIFPENESFVLNNMKKLKSYLHETKIIVGGNLRNELIEKLAEMKIEYISSLDLLLKKIEVA